MKRGYGSIYLVIFLDMLGFGTIIPVIRDLTRELLEKSNLDLSKGEIYGGILMAAYSFAQFLASPLIGRLSDQYGRKPLLLFSVMGNALAYLMWALSQNFGVFLISRLLAGISGGNIGVAQSYLADTTEESERAKAMGMMGAIFGLGFILGPFLGAELSKFSMDASFSGNSFAAIGYFTFALNLMNFLWILFALREPQKRRLQETQRKLLNPKVLWEHLSHGPVAKLLAVYFLLQLGFVQLESVLAWDLLYRFSFSTQQTGYFFAAMGVVMIVVQGGIYRYLVAKYPVARIATLGLLVTTLAYFILPWQNIVLMYFIGITFLAYGLGTTNPSMPTLISFKSNAQEQGFHLGIMHSLGALSRIIAPILATSSFHFWRPAPFLASSILTLGAYFLLKQEN